MKIIITKEQYKLLVFSLFETLVGKLSIKTIEDKQKENNDKHDYHELYDESGEDIAQIWAKNPLRNKGCKKDLNLENKFSQSLENYIPYFKHKIFSEVLIEYVYKYTGIKCDCVQYDYDFKYHVDKIGDNEEYEYTKAKTRKYNVKKKKKIKESVEGKSSLENLIHGFLNDDFYPDYNWGPELFDFYREDVKEYGLIPFYINDSEAYVYYDDGTLEIMPWVCKKLDYYFNHLWYSPFKTWFEEKSGLKVSMMVDSRNNNRLLEESVDGKSSLENLIYSFLQDDFSPDYNWGPELFDFYDEEVRVYGLIPFYINDSEAYVYYGDGTLEIMPWVCEKLDGYFNNLWVPIFKSWFEEHSGLKVERIVNSKDNHLLLGESIDKNKKFLIDIMGIDFTDKIQQITSTYKLPMVFIYECLSKDTINGYLNHWGPMYLFELDGVKYLYQNRGEFEWFVNENCDVFFDNQITEKLGISILGLRFSDIIDMYFQEDENL